MQSDHQLWKTGKSGKNQGFFLAKMKSGENQGICTSLFGGHPEYDTVVVIHCNWSHWLIYDP